MWLGTGVAGLCSVRVYEYYIGHNKGQLMALMYLSTGGYCVYTNH
jgi:hypothetical protein